MADLHWRRKVLLAKLESTYGSNPTAVSTDAVLTRNLRIRPYVGPTVERNNDRLYLGAFSNMNVAPHGEVSFDVELAGSSAAGTAPAWSALMKGASCNEAVVALTSTTYTPSAGDASDEFPSIALETYIDSGFKQVLLGCRGNVQLVINAGEYPLMRYDFWGIFAAPADAAIAAMDVSDYVTALPVTDANTPTVTLDGTAVTLHSLTLNLGNQLVYRDMPNVGERVLIASRKPSGQITIEAPDMGSKDFFAKVRSDVSAQTVALSVVHGTSAGNIITVSCPVVQLSNPQWGEADGIATLTFDLTPLPNTGNDEISIAIT